MAPRHCFSQVWRQVCQTELIGSAVKKNNGVATLPLDPATWMEQHGTYLFKYARARVHDRALAEDLVQDTFLAALQCCDRFNGQSSERTWLVSILKHKTVDHYRKAGRYDQLFHDDKLSSRISAGFCPKIQRPLEHVFPELQEDCVNPSTAMEASAFWSVFQHCLSCLPERLACVFILREIERVAPKVICEKMDISEGNLWVMMSRARTCLRRCLQVNWLNGRR